MLAAAAIDANTEAFATADVLAMAKEPIAGGHEDQQANDAIHIFLLFVKLKEMPGAGQRSA